MKMKKCKLCKIEFNFGNKKRIFCSDNCRTKQYQKNINLSKKRNRLCVHCKDSFYDTSRTNRKLYCSKKCNNQFNHLKNKSERNSYSTNYNKNYYQINKKNLLLNLKKYKCENRNKVLAQQAVTKDKRQRPELYPKECIICGSKKNIQFHHPCYDFELSVYPLCTSHHRILHTYDKEVLEN